MNYLFALCCQECGLVNILMRKILQGILLLCYKFQCYFRMNNLISKQSLQQWLFLWIEKVLGRGKSLRLFWVKVKKLFSVLKYNIHWMSLEVITQNYNKKVTVCFLLISPVTWFHFSNVSFLISWGSDMLRFILQICKSWLSSCF